MQAIARAAPVRVSATEVAPKPTKTLTGPSLSNNARRNSKPKKRVTAREINILIPGALDAPERLSAKGRYGRREDTGVALRTGEDEIVFTFGEAVRAPCPGQSLVIYDGDSVVAGGIIEKAE